MGVQRRREWPQCHKESSWQVRQSRLCQKEKEQSRLSRSPDSEVGESQGERESHLGEREWRKKGGLYSESKEVRGASKESPPRRSRKEA